EFGHGPVGGGPLILLQFVVVVVVFVVRVQRGESNSWTGRNTTSIPACNQIARVMVVVLVTCLLVLRSVHVLWSTKPIGVVAMECAEEVAAAGLLNALPQLALPLLLVVQFIPKGAQFFVVVPLLVVATHTSIGLTTT